MKANTTTLPLNCGDASETCPEGVMWMTKSGDGRGTGAAVTAVPNKARQVSEAKNKRIKFNLLEPSVYLTFELACSGDSRPSTLVITAPASFTTKYPSSPAPDSRFSLWLVISIFFHF